MGNVGSLALDLVTAEGGPANETNCTVECFRLDGVSILRKNHLQFPPRRAFPLPAFPQMQNLRMMITPSLYKIVQSEFFTLDDGESKLEICPVQRDPAEWQPKFTLWNALANKFDSLKSAIDGQRMRLIDGTDIGVMGQGPHGQYSSSAKNGDAEPVRGVDCAKRSSQRTTVVQHGEADSRDRSGAVRCGRGFEFV